jgi:hypothetical protein
MRLQLLTLWSTSPSQYLKNSAEGGAHNVGKPVVIAGPTVVV